MCLSVPRVLTTAFAALLLSAATATAAPANWPNVDPRIASSLRSVLQQASDRLEHAECSALLSDYADARTGRPLAETLSRTGLSAGGWLRVLHFTSGDGRSGCADGVTLAYTAVGCPVVFVCPAYGKYRREDRSFAATALIHEALHTLGLGENPPSSREITLRIQERCGK